MNGDKARGQENGPTGASATGGTIPEGVWVLNQETSRKLAPTSHTLWIVKDDGQRLVWVSVETTADGDQLTTYANDYNAPPVAVAGSGFMASIASPEPGVMVTTGEVPGMGPFVETARVVEGGRRMLCDGRVETADGVLTWFEDFAWTGPSPHEPLRVTG